MGPFTDDDSEVDDYHLFYVLYSIPLFLTCKYLQEVATTLTGDELE